MAGKTCYFCSEGCVHRFNMAPEEYVEVAPKMKEEIAQTDLIIPSNAIKEDVRQLPADRGAKIVVYCRSGAMSATAAETLVQLGYPNILNLHSGMIAWKEQGYPLLQNPRYCQSKARSYEDVTPGELVWVR